MNIDSILIVIVESESKDSKGYFYLNLMKVTKLSIWMHAMRHIIEEEELSIS